MNRHLGLPFFIVAIARFLLEVQGQAPWFEKALVGIETGPTGAQFGSDEADLGYVAHFNGRDCIPSLATARPPSLLDGAPSSSGFAGFLKNAQRESSQVAPSAPTK